MCPRPIARHRRRAPDAAVPALDWWRGFRSSELTALMEAAQIYNLDIAVADAQIVQADAQVGISGAPLLPSLTGTATAERDACGIIRRIGRGGSAARPRSRNTISGSPRATWSISGARTARRSTRPKKTPRVARYNREVVTLTTIVTVANTYFQILAAQDQLRVARRNLAAAERILALIKQQFAGGTASQLDLSQQEALVATERASIPPLEVDAAAEHRRARRAGGARAGELQRATAAATAQIAVPRVTPGLPSELLYQRPDIRQAEAQLASSNFSVEVGARGVLSADPVDRRRPACKARRWPRCSGPAPGSTPCPRD